ncbi:MAG: lytic murein transglycosylase, partial [Pseudomonadota bacterium]
MMRRICAVALAAGVATSAVANATENGPSTSPDNGVTLASGAISGQVRPVPRPARLAIKADGSEQGFQIWLIGFRNRAGQAGISPETLETALDDVRFDPDVIRRDRNQSEFTKTIWDYLDTAVSDARIQNGRKALDAHEAKLDQIEQKYGVEKEIVTAIWGLESAYGG